MINFTDQTKIDEYLNKHLPYRVNSMLAYDLLLHRKNQNNYAAIKDSCYGDSLVVEPIFEISIIFGRSLLNFLGLSKENANDKITEFKPKIDDLTVKSLFPQRNYCPIDEQIVINSYNPLCKLISLANKSVAHLTSTVGITAPTQLEVLPQARLAIYQLVIKYLPEINKENIWWHTQFKA